MCLRERNRLRENVGGTRPRLTEWKYFEKRSRDLAFIDRPNAIKRLTEQTESTHVRPRVLHGTDFGAKPQPLR